MKKKLLVLLSGALLFCTASFAQGLHFGFKGGVNIFKVDGKSFKDEFKFGYNLGAFAEINFNKKWGLQPELMWSQTNFRTGEDFGNVYPDGISDVKGKLNYLAIPVLLSYRPVKIFAFQVGPQFGILLDKEKDILTNGKQAFKSGDFSLLAGAQLNLLKFKGGVRYVIGLSDINDVEDSNKWKNQGFQIYIGVRII